MVERSKYDRSFVLRGAHGAYVCSVAFRTLQALVATRAGMSHARWKCRYSAWCADRYLELECNVFGIAFGTLWEMTFHGLLEEPEDEGPLKLTELGNEVLDAIAALPAITLPEFVEVAA